MILARFMKATRGCPRWVAVCLCIAGVSAAIWWAAKPIGPSPEFVGRVAAAPHQVDRGDHELIVPAAALSAQLFNHLYPPEPSPQAELLPAPAPDARITLIAIVERDDRRRAFVRDDRENWYQWVGVGDQLSGGAEVISIDRGRLTLKLDNRSISMELPR